MQDGKACGTKPVNQRYLTALAPGVPEPHLLAEATPAALPIRHSVRPGVLLCDSRGAHVWGSGVPGVIGHTCRACIDRKVAARLEGRHYGLPCAETALQCHSAGIASPQMRCFRKYVRRLARGAVHPTTCGGKCSAAGGLSVCVPAAAGLQQTPRPSNNRFVATRPAKNASDLAKNGRRPGHRSSGRCGGCPPCRSAQRASGGSWGREKGGWAACRQPGCEIEGRGCLRRVCGPGSVPSKIAAAQQCGGTRCGAYSEWTGVNCGTRAPAL